MPCACLVPTHRGQKRVLYPLELEFRTVLSTIWMLEIECESSAKAQVLLTTQPALLPTEWLFLERASTQLLTRFKKV